MTRFFVYLDKEQKYRCLTTVLLSGYRDLTDICMR